jgi:hypothetical protein
VIKITSPKGIIELKVRQGHNLVTVAEEIVLKGGFLVEGMKESLVTYLQNLIGPLPETVFGALKDPSLVKPFVPTARPVFSPPQMLVSPVQQ